MKKVDAVLLVVVVLSTLIVLFDAVTAHAGGIWMCDLLWWIRH